MNWEEFFLAVPLIWAAIAWLVVIIIISLIKSYVPVKKQSKQSLLSNILPILALLLPLFIGSRLALDSFLSGSFFWPSLSVLGISIGGLWLGSTLVKVIVSVLGRQSRSDRAGRGIIETDGVTLNGTPLDDL